MTRLLLVALLGVGLCTPFALAETDIASPMGLDGFVKVEMLPIPSAPALQQGRVIWGENCQNCHGGNKATGAPKITSTRAWGSRVEKGLETLITHATEGFIGPRYTEMPPRGANPDLTDAEVAAAVAFMVWASGGADAAIEYITTN